jgi:hypothetical protein
MRNADLRRFAAKISQTVQDDREKIFADLLFNRAAAVAIL